MAAEGFRKYEAGGHWLSMHVVFYETCISTSDLVKIMNHKSGKGFIIPSDGRKEVQVHISAFTPRDAEVLIPGLRVEFCRVNGLRGPTAANVYLS